MRCKSGQCFRWCVQGMGEPLHNLDAVLAAVDIMTDPLGLQLSHNKVRLCADHQ